MENPLDRFINAQAETYSYAMQEIKAGHKRSHWMWYIFPQIHGLGRTAAAQYYAIQSRQEALDYLKHPILGHRLLEISYALLLLDSNNAADILGYTDSLKLRSCMTLFYTVSHNFIFKKVLEKFFHGELDPLTLDILNKEEQ